MTESQENGRAPLRLRDFPAGETPRERMAVLGEQALSTAELLAVVIGTGHGDDHVLQLAQVLLSDLHGLPGLARASMQELQQVRGIGEAKAGRIKASFELGRRMMKRPQEERPAITTPAQAAELLMPEMSHLEQEHLRLILLDSRNRVLSMPTLYIGSLNTSVIRIGEVFRAAIRENAAAVIAGHNHPSGDPSPSPEDVQITRQMVAAGRLLGISFLDHIICGRQGFVSLKERALGFDDQSEQIW